MECPYERSQYRPVFLNKIIQFPGFAWKIARCPICGNPIGWIWEPIENLEHSKPLSGDDDNRTSPRFYSLRLDKVLDPGSRFLGPAIEVPDILKSIWNKIGWVVTKKVFQNGRNAQTYLFVFSSIFYKLIFKLQSPFRVSQSAVCDATMAHHSLPNTQKTHQF